MVAKRTKAKDLKRRTGKRPERKTFLIFCEGEASEPDYIKGLKKLPEIRQSTSIGIEIDPDQGVPLTLVERAVQRKEVDHEIDEYWCIFDVEWPRHHPNLDKARELAATHGIQLAISNPCFEIWLLLHFDYVSGFVDTPSAESRSRHKEGRSGKRLDASKYMPLRREAVKHAAMLEAKHKGDGTKFPDNNPSSSMYKLMNVIDPLP